VSISKQSNKDMNLKKLITSVTRQKVLVLAIAIVAEQLVFDSLTWHSPATDLALYIIQLGRTGINGSAAETTQLHHRTKMILPIDDERNDGVHSLIVHKPWRTTLPFKQPSHRLC